MGTLIAPIDARKWPRLRWPAAAILGALAWMAAGSALQEASTAAAGIRGTVRDGAGAAVSQALVRLEREGEAPRLAETDGQGDFAFAVGTAGAYRISAEKDGRRSEAITVNAGTKDGARRIVLTLETGKQAADVDAMEFADKPNFTIAAVTDWTAAGGHGSDAVLRTSEALNREALVLKPEKAAGADTARENALRAAATNAPGSLEANRALGGFYLGEQRFRDAIVPLEAAYKIDPGNAQVESSLARALMESGDLAQAREHVEKLLARGENADAHRLAGALDERAGDPLAAVHEFERAVRADPSEQNYFEWGSELLLHRAIWQAKDVFTAGVKAYPGSERMLTALGAALFAGALYDEAARRLCQASDLNPADAEPYTFMGRIEMSAPNPLPCVEEKLARFVRMRPGDALANYFYAMTVWKQAGNAADAPVLERVKDLLTRAVRADPKCSEAYLQLGILEVTRHDYAEAIEFYKEAIAADPQLSQAHYRLAVAYDRVGQKEKARQEFQVHEQMEKQQAAAVEKQRREVRQFLVVKTPAE